MEPGGSDSGGLRDPGTVALRHTLTRVLAQIDERQVAVTHALHGTPAGERDTAVLAAVGSHLASLRKAHASIAALRVRGHGPRAVQAAFLVQFKDTERGLAMFQSALSTRDASARARLAARARRQLDAAHRAFVARIGRA